MRKTENFSLYEYDLNIQKITKIYKKLNEKYCKIGE